MKNLDFVMLKIVFIEVYFTTVGIGNFLMALKLDVLNILQLF